MAKGHIDTLLSFQIFLISRAKFSYIVIFSASVLGTLCVKGTAISITSDVLFSLSIGAVSGLLKYTDVSGMADLSQYKNFLADFSTGLVCIYSMAEYFCQVAYTLWQSVGESYLPVGCVSRHKRIQIVTSTLLLLVHFFCPLYYSASVVDVHC
jgi:hypothetical protein